MRKFQFEPKVTVVVPAPLGPEAVAVPKNDADPLIGAAWSEVKQTIARKVDTTRAKPFEYMLENSLFIALFALLLVDPCSGIREVGKFS